MHETPLITRSAFYRRRRPHALDAALWLTTVPMIDGGVCPSLRAAVRALAPATTFAEDVRDLSVSAIADGWL
jgi:hypothetical protein